MVDMKNQSFTLEEKIFELVSEYGALKTEQVKRYFDIEEEKLEKMAVRLMKKGRMKYDRKNGYLRMLTQKEYDDNLTRSFWLVIDLKEQVEYHGAGKYPLYIAMYADGKAYEIYSCKKGDEFTLNHVVSMLKEPAEGKVLIVIEDVEQMQQLNLENCTYCIVDDDGQVKYFE